VPITPNYGLTLNTAAGTGALTVTGFHHDNADMGHRIERAERVHLSSIPRIMDHPGTRL